MGDRRHEFPEAVDLFSYWTSGSSCHYLAEDPCQAGEPCLPFHVALRGDGYIPLSLLVFARDAVHARARVEATLRKCYALGKPYRDQPHVTPSHGTHLIEQMDRGDLVWHVAEYDTSKIAAKVNWASNGGTSF